jgi:hypothetical protein
LITEDDVLSIIETAKVKGITTVTLHTNYGVAIHSHTLKTAKRFNGFYINKLIAPMTAHAYTLHLIDNATEDELNDFLDELQTDLHTVKQMDDAVLVREKEMELNIVYNLLNN